MTKEEVIAKLQKLQKSYDEESSHVDADGLLCEFLESLGYEDVVTEWRKVPKWYC